MDSRTTDNKSREMAPDCKVPLQPRTDSFWLDRWLVLPDSNELCAESGEKCSLEPRLMLLLCLLAASPHRVISREELMTRLWPRVIVNENSLTRAISDLRRQLGKQSTGTSFIDTIPKTGYRLSANCQLREHVESTAAGLLAYRPSVLTVPVITAPSGNIMARLQRSAMSPSAFALAASFVLAIALTALPSARDTQFATPAALADINLSSQADFDALLEGRLETVAADMLETPGIDKLDTTQPVLSKDGGLFAYIRYHDQGSSLVLGSTAVPSSPVTVFTTEDSISNLQWSPVRRALLFAQTPKLTNAALLPGTQQASLVMFDLENFSTRVLDGPEKVPERETQGADEPRSFKLTSLSASLDWLS